MTLGLGVCIRSSLINYGGSTPKNLCMGKVQRTKTYRMKLRQTHTEENDRRKKW